MMKKALILAVVGMALVAGIYFWRMSTSTTEIPSPAVAPVEAPEEAVTEVTETKRDLGHPLPGEIIAEEQTFLQEEYGFALTLPQGWMVRDWTNSPPARPGQRRPSYTIRLEDPKTGSVLSFAVHPFTDKSRYAVEEIFISKMEAPVPDLRLDIQVDEVNELEDMRVRRAEMTTRNAQGTMGRMSAYYYLASDKFYSYSLLIPEPATASGDSRLARLLDRIRILG